MVQRWGSAFEIRSGRNARSEFSLNAKIVTRRSPLRAAAWRAHVLEQYSFARKFLAGLSASAIISLASAPTVALGMFRDRISKHFLFFKESHRLYFWMLDGVQDEAVELVGSRSEEFLFCFCKWFEHVGSRVGFLFPGVSGSPSTRSDCRRSLVGGYLGRNADAQSPKVFCAEVINDGRYTIVSASRRARGDAHGSQGQINVVVEDEECYAGSPSTSLGD